MLINSTKGVPRRSIKFRNIDSTINWSLPLDSQYYCTIILIAQIIVSCRGNIGSCAIYSAIVTLDVKYCTNSQSSPLCLTSFLLPIYLVSYIFDSFLMNICIYKCVIDHLYTIFINFISYFPLNAFVNYFFIALCVSTLVFELFINMIIVWIFFFILLVGVSICFHSYKLYIFYKGISPEQY